MATSSSTEDQVKRLQTHFGAIVATVKDLKSSVDELKKVVACCEQSEVKEVIETQKVIDEIVVANSDAIRQIKLDIAKSRQDKGESLEGKNQKPNKEWEKETDKGFDKAVVANSEAVKRIDKEIKSILKEKKQKNDSRKEVCDSIERLNNEIIQIKRERKIGEPVGKVLEENVGEVNKKKKKCRYFNCGYCKYKEKCRFEHPTQICEDYRKGKCVGSKCPFRHPKSCKWLQSSAGCKREDCDFMHDTLAHVEKEKGKVEKETQLAFYECAGCKDKWQESQLLVKHRIQNMEVYFCLNCEDWIKEKDRVFDEGWSLLDSDGNLKYFA